MDEKLIKITVRKVDGHTQEIRCTHFEVKPCRDGGRLYLKIDSKSDIVCTSIEVEQKEIEGAFCL